MANGRYAKVYDQLEDEFPAVYDDDAALAAYTRLLKIANDAWPQCGRLPRSLKPGALRKLKAATLVEIVAGDRFRIRGLAGERERRSAAGKAGADARWSAASNPHGNAEGNANRNAN